jgi:uncharacterized protein (DUF1501 family)
MIMKETRREFLKKSGCALGVVTLATQMQHFGLMSALAQKMEEAPTSEGGENYKAIVLLFWSGGNDGNNTVIPNHNDATVSNYAAYFNERNPSTLAIPQASLLPISVPLLGLDYGLHPNFGTVTGGINAGIHPLWAAGDLAIVPNVGTLVAPMTRAQYQNNSIQKPYQLFSHSDQVAQYQTSISNTQAFTGWGGRVADNLTPGQNPNGLIPMITSISGAQLFTSGQTTLPMAIANAGTGLNNVLNPTGFNTTAASVARRNAFNELRTVDLDSSFVAAASHVTDLAIAANTQLQSFQEVTVTFPTTNIGQQLKQVARLVKKRLDLNVNRQIFYCQLGGFDTHNNEITVQANLISQFSQAVRAFYDEMAVQGVSNNVTTFTLSDFNRTFNPTGTGATVGTDHAWGNHMFVIGGGVAGGNFYGNLRPDGTGSYYPTLVKGGPDDADGGTAPRGRWIPTTSVEQYSNTLAKWFGLPQNSGTLETIFPNLDNFASPTLNFLP